MVRYLRHETFPERKGRGDAGRSLLDPWKPLLLERWNAGRRDSRRLFRELQAGGYRGSYATLARYTQRLRQAQEGAAPRRPSRKRPPLPPVVDPPGRPLTPRTAAWLALRRPERRDPDGAERLARLGERDPALAEAVGLAEEFAGLLRAREPGRLDPWLARARDGPLPAFRGFAARPGHGRGGGAGGGDAAVEHGAGRGADQSAQDAQAADVRPRQARPARPALPARGVIIKSGQEPVIGAPILTLTG